ATRLSSRVHGGKAPEAGRGGDGQPVVTASPLKIPSLRTIVRVSIRVAAQNDIAAASALSTQTNWRTGWDSDPRYPEVHPLSRRAQSSTLAPLRRARSA